MEAQETHEHVEHAEEAGHKKNKRAAILIIALAAALAILEMAGKQVQFASVADNIEVSDLWAFYQAKTIRETTVHMAIESAALLREGSPERAAAIDKQVAEWKAIVDRFESDPKSGEGRKELTERAHAKTARRDVEIHAYHDFEVGSAALQLAIVMASAAVITELIMLEIVAFGLGAIGIAFGAVGWFLPGLLPI